MKRKQLLLAIAAMLLPMSMMAQTYHFHEKDGLRYIYQEGDDTENDANLFIIVNGSLTVDGTSVGNKYFVPHDGLRAAWRYKSGSESTCIKKIDGTPLGSDRWYKNDMDAITTFLGDWGNNGPTTFQGIEYFRNITSLTVKQNGNGGSQLELDLSKNTKLQTLAFNTPSDARIKSLNISNCTDLTSITLPSGSNSYLKSFKAENSGLTGALNLSTLSVLETVDLSNSPNLTSLTMPSATGNIKSLDLRDCTGLASTYSDTNQLDLRAYTNMNRFNVRVLGSGLVPGESILFNEDLTIKELNILDAEGEEWDLNSFTELQRVYCYNASKLDVSACTKLKFLEVKGPRDTDLILSKDNTDLLILDVSHSGMTKLDLSGESGTGTTSNPNLSLAPNLKLVACCYAPIETLDLRNHTKLEYIAVKSESGGSTDIKGFTPFNTHSQEPAGVGGEKPTDYRMIAFIDSCKNSPNFDINYEHNSGSYKDAADKNDLGYGIDYSTSNKTFYNAENKLREVNIEGCTMLRELLLTSINENNKRYEYTQIEKIDAWRCGKLRRIVAINGRLSTLRVRACYDLEYVAVEQNYLDENSFAGDNSLSGVQNLQKFIAHRNRFTNLDFLTKPIGSRTATHIKKLQQIQVNGGSYVIRDPDTDYYISHLIDGDGSRGADTGKRNHKFTSALKRLDTSFLGEDMRILYCGDNMLEKLDISTMPKLRQFECKNNMLLTLDLSKFRDPEDATPDPGETGGRYVTQARWGDQVAFLDVEVVKGKIDETKGKEDPGIKGLNDLVALHMPNGGYRHDLDNDLELYRNLADEQAGINKVADEANAHMCYIQNHDDVLCPTDHTGAHLFLHTGQEIIDDFGKVKDQDLYGGVLKYNYDTQVLSVKNGFDNPTQAECQGGPSGDGTNTWVWETSTHGGAAGYPVLRGREYAFHNSSLGTVDKHVNVRVHIWPYIMYVNPATRSTYKDLGVEKEIDYYSGTIYLDYDAIVPEGLEVYVAAGLARKTVEGEEEEVKDTTLITSHGTSEADKQLRMVKVGEAGDIIPKLTPLYVKPVLPSAAKQAGGWSQPAAGLYAFQTAWDFVLHGWEDYRGCAGVPGIDNSENYAPKLYGPDVENYDPSSMVWKDGCDPATNPEKWINNKVITLDKKLEAEDEDNKYTGQELFDRNILSGTLEEIDLTNNSLGLTRRSVLVLGLESQKGTNMIGFWPQNAKKIGAHRCYITYDDAMGISGASIPQTSVTGFKFSFAGDDFSEANANEELGDSNNDGVVSIADVTAIINKINGVVTGTFAEKAADVNKDGVISIADVTGIINIINNNNQ